MTSVRAHLPVGAFSKGVMAQAVTQLARFLGDMYARLPPPVMISPTLEFLQAVGSASSNPLISFILARSSSWCVPLCALTHTSGTSSVQISSITFSTSI